MALALGKTAREIREEIDSEELTEWIAFDKIYHLPDPFWIGGMICATMANCHRGPFTRPYEPEGFMPKRVRVVIQQTDEQIRNHLDSLLGQSW